MRIQDVTVIVPTKNETANILPFLDSLHPEIRLIVVDASDDDTPRIVERHRSAHSLVLRRTARIAEARQIGACAASTEWLLFTDADISFAPDYFGRLEAHPGNADVIYGTKLSADAYTGYYRWLRRGQAFLHWLGIPAASGSNLLIRRDVLFAAGGFDLALTVNEDSEIAWRIKRRGYRAAFARDLAVYERDHRRLRRGVLRKTLHSTVRCTLLYFNLMPERWKSQDWGYWSKG